MPWAVRLGKTIELSALKELAFSWQAGRWQTRRHSDSDQGCAGNSNQVVLVRESGGCLDWAGGASRKASLRGCYADVRKEQAVCTSGRRGRASKGTAFGVGVMDPGPKQARVFSGKVVTAGAGQGLCDMKSGDEVGGCVL